MRSVAKTYMYCTRTRNDFLILYLDNKTKVNIQTFPHLYEEISHRKCICAGSLPNFVFLYLNFQYDRRENKESGQIERIFRCRWIWINPPIPLLATISHSSLCVTGRGFAYISLQGTMWVQPKTVVFILILVPKNRCRLYLFLFICSKYRCLLYLFMFQKPGSFLLILVPKTVICFTYSCSKNRSLLYIFFFQNRGLLYLFLFRDAQEYSGFMHMLPWLIWQCTEQLVHAS
jgi:hypothetical protein